MTTKDWEAKMRVIQELEKAKVELSHAQWAVMYEQAAMALKMPPIPVELRYRPKPSPALPEPDFSLDELEKAQKVIDNLR